MHTPLGVAEIIDNNLNPKWRPQQLKQQTVGMDSEHRFVDGSLEGARLRNHSSEDIYFARSTCQNLFSHLRTNTSTHSINNEPTHSINAPLVHSTTSMVKIDVYDFDDHTSHDLIGCFTATVAELKSRVTNGAKLSKAQQVRTDRTFLAPENLGRL